MSPGTLLTLDEFNYLKVLVIGDAILDVYIRGRVRRLSREAPVPIVDVEDVLQSPGGGANTAVNVAALSGSVDFLSVVGADLQGELLKTLLTKQGVGTQHVLVDSKRRTLSKQRVSSEDHLFLRFDEGTNDPIAETVEKKFITMLEKIYVGYDAVIVSDYGYGIMTSRVIGALKRLQRKYPKVLFVDSKYLPRYKSLAPTAVKPNYQEATHLLSLDSLHNGKRIRQMSTQGNKLFRKTGATIVALTLDRDGALIFEKGKRTPYRTFTKAAPHNQAAGAGDTFAAAFAMSLATGAMVPSAAELAAASAKIVAAKQGTAVCTSQDLKDYFQTNTKVVGSKQALKTLIAKYRAEGKRIVFSNGCFDILHRGHVTYLNRAKERGDILVIGVNSDESVQLLKGPERPINPLADRMRVLSALSSVDHVISFSEKTPIKLIQLIKPDVFVKGGDYTRETLPEVPHVERYGGFVEILPFLEERSTTSIIKRIRDRGEHSVDKTQTKSRQTVGSGS